MAYIKHIKQDCRGGGCMKQATAEVFNMRNSSHGYFCMHHAKLELARLESDEKPRTVHTPRDKGMS